MLQLPTPITFADWDDFAVAIRPWQSLSSNEVDAQTKTRSFRPVPFHSHKNTFRTSCLLESPSSVLTQDTRKRLLFLLDARAVLGAFAKGRSSAPSLFRAVRQAAALQLAGDLVVRWVYITSESNLADAPSRGLHKERVSHRKCISPHVNTTI